MKETDFHPDLIEAKKEDIYYNLVMFPYPSGYGLHAGHASNYTIIDVNARFQRMLGKTVFNPFGFDSFGLPTENYAMKVGKPAYEVTKENTDYFLKQLKALNISFDYDRMVYTSNPDYYKWTQWIFMKLYEHGLVYRDKLYVNRCPECQTVLANDQVVEGKCERCKSEIIQKKHPQRFIKITDYADRLIKDLDLIDRPKETKTGQKNRIGRSTGAEIDFEIGENKQNITCFTTRPDTIYGVTALVLAPENTDIDKLLSDDKKKEVEKYRQKALSKTAIQRQQDAKEKTGVFSGIYANHPLTNEQIPIRFADYVLADYGSGAIMIVPAHDERDRDFAKRFDIKIIEVISPTKTEDKKEDQAYTGDGTLINSDILNGLTKKEAIKKMTEHLESIGKGRAKITYKLRDRSVSRQRYRGAPVPIYYKTPDDQVPLYEYQDGLRKHKEGEPTKTRYVIQAIVKDKNSDQFCFLQQKKVDDLNGFFGGIDEGETAEQACMREIREEAGLVDAEIKKEVLDYHCKFYHPTKHRNQYSVVRCFYIEADKSTQQDISQEEKENHDVVRMTAEEFLKKGTNKTTIYCLNVLLNNKQEERPTTNKYNEFNPVPETDKIPHLIPEEQLPVELPLDIKNYKPKGKSPLADHPTFPIYKDEDGNEYQRECDTLDTFMCSSFYFLRYPDANNPDELISEVLREKMFPIDFYCGGKEHTVGHLLYSRFIHKFLHDIGYVSSLEPFQRLVHQGMVLGADGRKMSKRRGNVIDPLDIIEKYSSDVLRTYLMFMGPVESDKARDENGVKGIQKFLLRIEKLRKDGKVYEDPKFTKLTDEEKEKGLQKVEATLHKIIKDITNDMQKMKYNTAVSKLMILVNKIYEIGSAKKKHIQTLVIMLAPFATDLSSQMRRELGNEDDIHYHLRPVFDESKILTEDINLPIQFNGKMRGTITVSPGTDQNIVLEKIKEDGSRNSYLEGEIKKIIFVQDKIINIIMK